jgi:hypothetical protein
MMVLSTRYRNLLGRLFSDSVSRELSQTSTVPLIAFHHRNKKSIKLF